MISISSLRLVAQQLVRSTFTKPSDIVAWMGAIQAQDVNMAKWAIGVRLPGFTKTKITTACNKGEILRTHVLRPTWHFVAPADIRWMLELSKDRIKAQFKARDKDLELDEKIYTKSNKIIVKALEGGKHLVREDLAFLLEKAKIAPGNGRIYHIMMNAELDGLVCSGAMKGKEQTYALLDEWVAPAKTLTKEEALATLALRYFSSHGPATLPDFVWWSGLAVADARKGLQMVQQQLENEKINDTDYWFSAEILRKTTDTASHYCLLPAWDEYLVGYRDRSDVLHSDNHRTAISSNGIFRPVIVANGKVVGLWKKSARKTAVVEPLYFKKSTQQYKKAETIAIREFEQFI